MKTPFKYLIFALIGWTLAFHLPSLLSAIAGVIAIIATFALISWILDTYWAD